MLALSPVNTYQAYNNFPADGLTGKSLYDYNSYGKLTVNGATVGCSSTDYVGSLFFGRSGSSNFDPGSESASLYCNNGDAMIDATLYPGSYDLEYHPGSYHEGRHPPCDVTVVTRIQIN